MSGRSTGAGSISKPPEGRVRNSINPCAASRFSDRPPVARNPRIGDAGDPTAFQAEASGLAVMTFFSEIKRRKVFRIGAAYLIVGWIIMQVTDLVVPVLHLPEWVTTLVLFLLLVGFPVALILAWAYEITPNGIKRTKDLPSGRSPDQVAGRRLDFLVIALLAAAVGFLAADKYLWDSVPPVGEAEIPGSQQLDSSPPRVSIAVLPFANMSGDPGQEHFADGLSEELLNSLAGIDALRVISRTSSFAFKGKDTPIGEIAASLDVGHILEGSVRRAGSRIRVTAQLIDAGSDSHLWSQSYDRELSLENILEIQEEIAGTVIAALQSELLPQSFDSRVAAPNDLAALDLYHDGMYFLRQIETQEAYSDRPFTQAIEKFEAAIETDPGWAPPHAALGRVYHFWKDVGDTAEKLRISKGHVMDAIRIDDRYGPAYNSLGYILTVEGDYDGAMHAYDRAADYGIEDSWGKAILMLAMGRPDDAVDHYRSAITRDPLAFLPRMQLVLAYRCAGQYHEVIAALEGADEVLAASPSAEARMILAEAYARTGKVETALQMAENGARPEGSDVPLAVVFALAGREARARAALENLDSGNEAELLSAAGVSVLLGEAAHAVTYLESAARLTISRSRLLNMRIDLHCTPEFRELANNPRYEAVLADVAPKN